MCFLIHAKQPIITIQQHEFYVKEKIVKFENY